MAPETIAARGRCGASPRGSTEAKQCPLLRNSKMRRRVDMDVSRWATAFESRTGGKGDEEGEGGRGEDRIEEEDDDDAGGGGADVIGERRGKPL